MNTPPIFDRAPKAAEAAIDEAHLQELAESVGTGVMRELLEIFRQDSRPRLERLKTSCQAGSSPAIRAEAHFLAGSSANLGMRGLARRFLQLEKETHHSFGVDLMALGRSLETEWELACAAWERALEEIEKER